MKIKKFFEILKKGSNNEEIMIEFDKLDLSKINHRELLKELVSLNSGDFPLIQLSAKLESFVGFVNENEKYNKKEKTSISNLYEFVEMQTILLTHMRFIDEKTEENKKDLLEGLKEKDRELQGIKEKSEKELDKLKEEIKNVDEEAMKKMGMYLSVFTLIAGNIAVLFKGIEVSSWELAGLIFIVNSTLLISIRMLFYFVNETRKVTKDIVIIFIVGLLLGLVCLHFSKDNLNSNEIKQEYKEKFDKYDEKISQYEQKID